MLAHIPYRLAILVIALSALLLPRSTTYADILLDDRWADGSRAESKRPAEAAVWVGREQDVTMAAGALTAKLGDASQKIWTYFTDGEPVTLNVGQKLTASVSFIPRQAIAQTSSRSFRIGLFNDPTSPRVEANVNSDGGGEGAPWTDATGYAVQVLITNTQSTAKPFDLGKRTNLKSESLLGTSGDYTKKSGGNPVGMKVDTEYRVELSVEKQSDKKVSLTSSLYQGSEQLSTFSLSDDGSQLGAAPINDKFDLLYIRLANRANAADQIDFTELKVEVSPAKLSP